jgi:tetratricopeptide (TPR) repeat protein
MAIEGRGLSIWDLLELSDMARVDEEMEGYSRLAEELRQPVYYWETLWCRAMRALLDGRFEDGERWAREAFAIGKQMRVPNASLAFSVQMFTIRREQSRLAEIEFVMGGADESGVDTAVRRTWRAVLYSETGREVEARTDFELLAANTFSDLPPVYLWLTWLQALLSEVCASLGDAKSASTLYNALRPHARYNVLGGIGHFVCLGSTSRYLGLLATTMQRWADAERHFDGAIEMNTRMGARPWVTWTQRDYAKMLLARDEPGDRDKARVLLEEALTVARELGMKALEEKASALLNDDVARE